MYVTETTKNVRELFEELENIEDISRLKFLLYIFDLLNNDQINNKKEVNPSTIDDEDLEIFTFESMGLSRELCEIFLLWHVAVFNHSSREKKVYIDNGNVLGIEYSKNEEKILSTFEQLTFEEMLDVFSEFFIRYDNETFFKRIKDIIRIEDNLNGFDVAKLIQDYKKELNTNY